MSTSLLIPRKARIFLSCALLLALVPAYALAQDGAQVLALSVRFGTVKNTKQLNEQTLAEVNRLQKLAQEANAAKRYGEALKNMYHGLALMDGQEWSPLNAFRAAVTVKAERTMLEPSQTVRLHIGQFYALDQKVEGSVNLSIAIKTDETAPPIKVLQSTDGPLPDYAANPSDAVLTVPDIPDGNYRLNVTFKPAAGDAISKSIPVRVDRGLSAKVAAAKKRAADLEALLKSKKQEALLSAIATAEYQIGLFDLANAGEINLVRVNFNEALNTANAMLDEISAGKDPLAARRGDFKKAYRSKVDDTLQPYRLFVPSSYDGSKTYPLIIALHGMGGDENSYFDGYANGAFKTAADSHGYIVACPKGRQSASMYVGSAEKDVMDVLAEVERSYQIDPDRVYMTGHSMGGFGTWSVAINHPEVFAAIAPIAGGGNPMEVAKIAQVPALVVHGDADKTVPVARSRTMVAAEKQAGGEVKYIEVPNGSHISIVVPTFNEVFQWFDSHKRKTSDVKAAAAQGK